ncbi:MAG: nucleotidyltransferase domain-containing protein [Haloarculaceae archaeon]
MLLLLSRNRFEEFTIGDLATQLPQSGSTVRRAVDTLLDNELVIEDATGNRRLVRINRERLSAPDDPILEIPQLEFQQPVAEAVDRLTELLDDPVAIILYGSVARGEADRRSDIDLWVLVRQDRPAAQRAANRVVNELESLKVDGERYSFDIDVESVDSLPQYTADVAEIVVSGIPVHSSPDFATVKNLVREEVNADER